MTNDPYTRCTIETVYLKNQPQYTELCETKVDWMEIFIEYDEILPNDSVKKSIFFSRGLHLAALVGR